MTRTDLVTLVYQKKLAELQRAVRSGADINARDEHGPTPLMHAVLAAEPLAQPEALAVAPLRWHLQAAGVWTDLVLTRVPSL